MIDNIEETDFVHAKITDPENLSPAEIFDMRNVLGVSSGTYLIIGVDTGLASALGTTVEVTASCRSYDYPGHTATINDQLQIEDIASTYGLSGGQIPVAIPYRYDPMEESFYDSINVTISNSENSTTFIVYLEKAE